MSNVQGNIVVQRIKNGDTISTMLQSTKDLFQAISADGGVIAPDFGVASNQPTISPYIQSALTAKVLPIVDGSDEWYYNTIRLVFDSSGVCTAPAAAIGKFKRNANGTLSIINNLASASNKNSDTIRFEGVAQSSIEIRTSATIDVRIEEVSASAYNGVIDLSSSTIATSSDTVTAKARLVSGVTEMAPNAFTVKWYRAVTASEDNDGVADNWVDFKPGSGNSVTITESDVSGQQLFKADFYVEGKVVSSSLFNVIDTQDPKVITFDNNSPTLTDSTPSVVIRARLISRDQGVESSGAAFTFDAYNSRGRKITLAAASTSNTFTVSTADTDRKESGESEENGNITVIATTTY